MVFGLCARCVRTHERLPTGTVAKRLNAAAARAASDISGRYWTARFPDHGAAVLAANMIGFAGTREDALAALDWR